MYGIATPVAETNRTLSSNHTTPGETVSATVPQPHLAAEAIVATSRYVEKAPLELEFESVMLRPSAPNTDEGNIIFTAREQRTSPRAVVLSF
ncbi:hypothetical protein PDE_07154 [Penicillium oxalicum 114-2]|uniref:Uncharacterized protein n=1 Tax=Penicillium oxalicum (strain 114-2 / CGMCC 5302) TaxID=933388 RepID=S7ZP85_PENO1|nr:hypothetical protein PDE_07154 [Penicillium oxalicum 114-2]